MAQDQKRALLEELDRAANELTQTRSRAKYEDLSDLKNDEITRVATILASTIRRVAPSGSTYQIEADRIVNRFGVISRSSVEYLSGVLAALREDVDKEFLRTSTEFIHAEVFSDFLDMATYLLDEGYKAPSAVLVGGVLEEQLRKLATKNGLPIVVGSRPTKAEQLNADLARASVYSVLDQKSVTAWLDLRNKAAHGKHSEYTREQVALMLAGVREFAVRFPA